MPTVLPIDHTPLTLNDGWQLYKKHIERPQVTGGPKLSTQKRYRAVLDKFLPYGKSQGVELWNHVTADLVYGYAAHLERNGYAPKTIRNELVTVVQTYNFLRGKNGNGRLRGVEPLDVEVRQVTSERPYCYRREEVATMVTHCTRITS